MLIFLHDNQTELQYKLLLDWSFPFATCWNVFTCSQSYPENNRGEDGESFLQNHSSCSPSSDKAAAPPSWCFNAALFGKRAEEKTADPDLNRKSICSNRMSVISVLSSRCHLQSGVWKPVISRRPSVRGEQNCDLYKPQRTFSWILLNQTPSRDLMLSSQRICSQIRDRKLSASFPGHHSQLENPESKSPYAWTNLINTITY